MNCECGGDTRVVDSRGRPDNVIRRRRECVECGERFSTAEYPTSPRLSKVDPVKLELLKRAITVWENEISSAELDGLVARLREEEVRQ